MRLAVATVLLQWATGGLLFCWVTTRRREVGVGYGWLLRTTYLLMALLAALSGRVFDHDGGGNALLRDLAALAAGSAAGLALWVSIRRRRAGVAGERSVRAASVARVAAMTGRATLTAAAPDAGREFPPALDLLAPAVGLAGLLAAAAPGAPFLLSAARVVCGAAFLGAVTDAMLLGHWYLTQPRLGRAPLRQLVSLVALVWAVEVALLLWPTGMIDVLAGRVDDGTGGLIGIIWVGCSVITIGLCAAVLAALRERSYSAVMAATGLLYLAILTAFGTDLLARAAIGQ